MAPGPGCWMIPKHRSTRTLREMVGTGRNLWASLLLLRHLGTVPAEQAGRASPGASGPLCGFEHTSLIFSTLIGVIRCFCSWEGFPPQHTIHKGPFHYPVDASPVAGGDGEAASVHYCKWQLPGKGLEERKGPPWGEPFDSGVPCLTSSLVWVSFRSHGWLQHGRRPEGAC